MYFINLFKALFNISTVEVEVVEKVVVVEVLSDNAYKRLEKGLESPIVSGQDTPTNAAYKLGIQRALQMVRSNFSH